MICCHSFEKLAEILCVTDGGIATAQKYKRKPQILIPSKVQIKMHRYMMHICVLLLQTANM